MGDALVGALTHEEPPEVVQCQLLRRDSGGRRDLVQPLQVRSFRVVVAVLWVGQWQNVSILILQGAELPQHGLSVGVDRHSSIRIVLGAVEPAFRRDLAANMNPIIDKTDVVTCQHRQFRDSHSSVGQQDHDAIQIGVHRLHDPAVLIRRVGLNAWLRFIEEYADAVTLLGSRVLTHLAHRYAPIEETADCRKAVVDRVLVIADTESPLSVFEDRFDGDVPQSPRARLGGEECVEFSHDTCVTAVRFSLVLRVLIGEPFFDRLINVVIASELLGVAQTDLFPRQAQRVRFRSLDGASFVAVGG